MRHILYLIAFIMTTGAAYAEEWPTISNPCRTNPDSITIVDDGYDRAIVEFNNSEHGCSDNAWFELVSPNGITVTIETIVNAGADDTELIRVQPERFDLMAFPPEEYVKDGDSIRIIVMGGIS